MPPPLPPIDGAVKILNQRGYHYETLAQGKSLKESKKLWSRALKQYKTGIERIQVLYPELTEVLKVLQTLDRLHVPRRLLPPYPYLGKQSELPILKKTPPESNIPFSHVTDIMVISLFNKDGTIDDVLKDAIEFCQEMNFKHYEKEINSYRGSFNKLKKIPEEYSWTFAHYIVAEFQLIILQKNFRTVRFVQLVFIKAYYVVALLLKRDYSWIWSHLGDFYRCTAVLAALPFEYQIEIKNAFFLLSLSCFNRTFALDDMKEAAQILKEVTEHGTWNTDKELKKHRPEVLRLLWSQAHKASTFCNARMAKQYNEAETLLDSAFFGWEKIHNGTMLYSWGSGYLGVTHGLEVLADPTTKRAAEDLVDTVGFMFEGIARQTALIKTRIEPMQLTRNFFVATAFTLLVEELEKPPEQRHPTSKPQADLAKQVCKVVFERFQYNPNADDEKDVKKWILPDLEDVYNLGRVVYYNLTAHRLFPGPGPEPKALFYVKHWAKLVLEILKLGSSPGPLPPNEKTAYWHQFWVQWTDQEKVLYVVEVIFTLLRTHKKDANLEFESKEALIGQIESIIPGINLRNLDLLDPIFDLFFDQQRADFEKSVLKKVLETIKHSPFPPLP